MASGVVQTIVQESGEARTRHVLVVGGGFIGGALAAALVARGDRVSVAGRDAARLRLRFPGCTAIAADLTRDAAADWRARLAGIDAVVNAAGILRGDLDRVHAQGAIALFDACAGAGVRSVLQVSALGAGAHPGARFLASKARADDHLLALAEDDGRTEWHVIRPSLVIGRGGASTTLFCALAMLPLRLGPGSWAVQPVHVSDLVRVLLSLLDGAAAPAVLAVGGPDVMTTDQLTRSLGDWLGRPPRRPIPIPAPLLSVLARVGDLLPRAALTSESLGLLRAGNVCGSPAPIAREVRPLVQALAADPSTPADRQAGRLLPVRPLLLASLAAVWIGSGLVSLLLSPARAGSLMKGLGLSDEVAFAVTWGGAILDILLGAALLSRRARTAVLRVQIAVTVAYTILATVALLGLWLDPFGALLKNLAVVAASLALLALEG